MLRCVFPISIRYDHTLCRNNCSSSAFTASRKAYNVPQEKTPGNRNWGIPRGKTSWNVGQFARAHPVSFREVCMALYHHHNAVDVLLLHGVPERSHDVLQHTGSQNNCYDVCLPMEIYAKVSLRRKRDIYMKNPLLCCCLRPNDSLPDFVIGHSFQSNTEAHFVIIYDEYRKPPTLEG